MKTYKQLKKTLSKMPPGQHIYDKKIDGYSVMVHKDGNNFVVYIDNEKLDSYSSQQEAERMAKEFIKQVKG